MKNFLIAFLVFLVWSFFGLWLYSWLQPQGEAMAQTDTLTNVETPPVNPELDLPTAEGEIQSNNAGNDSIDFSENEIDVTLEDVLPAGLKATAPTGDVVFEYAEGVKIWRNTNQIKYENAVAEFKYQLQTHLNNNPDQELHIMSLYSAAENIVTPNFGFQRGEKIKTILRRVGIPAEKMVVKPLIRAIHFEEDDSYSSGIYFSFQPLDEERLEIMRLSVPDTKMVYPKLVDDNVAASPTLVELLEEVKTALANNPQVKVEVIGHTDNVGNANDNYLLGLKYARQVRWYLVTKGQLDPKRVIALSQGESKSIASNANARGRLLNRRIEIAYKTE